MTDQITTEYDLTKDDFIAFNLFVIESSPTLNKQWLQFLWFPIVAYMIFAIALGQAAHSEYSRSGAYMSFCIVACIWLIYARQYWNWSIRRRLNKLLAGGKNNGTHGIKSITIGPDGVHSSDEQSEAQIKWSAIEKIANSPSATYLFIGALSAVIVPHRAFATDGERMEFVSLAEKYQASNAND